MILTSTAFEQDGEIPRIHTCDGRDISPQLAWDNLPEGTKSLVLIVDDPDAPDPEAPQMIWVHWVLYNLSPDADELQEAIRPSDLPSGTLQGRNDWGHTGYRGPCPPIGRHRYFHKLYALDEKLPDLRTPSKTEVEKAMAGHVIAQTELVGTYIRGGGK